MKVKGRRDISLTLVRNVINMKGDCSKPILKYMEFPRGFFGVIDLEIVIFGTSYMLVAVAYTNDTHFKGRFLGLDGLIYEYDGMKRIYTPSLAIASQ
jgi:hypothetical protein